MRSRKQEGQVIRIGGRWYVRYWERRNISGTIERKRVTQLLGAVTTRGKLPPADIAKLAEHHMATVNNGTIPAERILTLSDFVGASICLGSNCTSDRPRTRDTRTFGKII